MKLWAAIKTGYVKYATFRGRASRSEYWYFFLFNFLLGVVSGIVDTIIWDRSHFGPFNLIFSVATFLPSVAVGVRRLHDSGRSGWWMLLIVAALIVVPVFFLMAFRGFEYGLFVIWGIQFVLFLPLFLWFCTRGTQGPNRFGEDPLESFTAA